MLHFNFLNPETFQNPNICVCYFLYYFVLAKFYDNSLEEITIINKKSCFMKRKKRLALKVKKL